MTEKMTEKDPPHVEQFTYNAHKNQPKGPKTGAVIPDWRIDRDYENFNPTAEK